jgi:hypothetical protein
MRKAPTSTVPVIDPRAVFTRDTLTATLGLRPNTIRREVREGRLRVSRRAGRWFFLGEWVTEWLRAGEVPRRRGQERIEPSTNGARSVIG